MIKVEEYEIVKLGLNEFMKTFLSGSLISRQRFRDILKGSNGQEEGINLVTSQCTEFCKHLQNKQHQ